MHHAVAMEGLEAGESHSQDLAHVPLRVACRIARPVARDHLRVQITARKQLHHDVRVGPRLVVVEQRDDVRVVDQPHELHLLTHALTMAVV